MKTALAIVCSLMLAWTNLVLAQAPAVSVASAAASCHCGKKSSCCAAKRSLPESPPVSAAPVPSFQSQISFIAPAAVAWLLADSPMREVPTSVIPSFPTAGTALLARNCAWLI
jgi:hypothetical protein